MTTSIDVIIPSYRLIAATLLPILKLEKPAGVEVRFYIIADNPAISVDKTILDIIDDRNVFLLINPVNMGASATRNRGIEAGKGSWLLFLDDDIDVPPNLLQTYANAAIAHPNEPGFIGVVDMPPAPTLFADAVQTNGSMGVFTVARQKDSFAWGATANIMVSRQAVGEVRFSDDYPKSGGGEEVEFFLRVRERNDFTNYRSLPDAAVTHPWWGNGKTDLLRFFRYGQGNSFLAARNKIYRWYDFLNTPETLLIAFVALIASLHSRIHTSVFAFFAASVIIEYIVTVTRVYRINRKVSPVLAWYVMLLRNVYEAGILYGNLKRRRLAGFGERFNYEGAVKQHNFRLNRFKIIKLALYIIAVVLTWKCVYTSR
ncbi:MAG: glycosyltransferase [Mucilaginibacter sp.]|nr:glycosyltransferase [Mucilaginibacter sp.]